MLIHILLAISLIYNVEAQVFDITKYGARNNNGDSTQGVLAAWKEACASVKRSEVVVPAGIYNVGRLNLQGPCKAPLTLKLQGTLKAPVDVNKLVKGQEWLSVYRVADFTLSGPGTIDGQGPDTWAKKIAKKVPFSQPTNMGLNFLTNARVEGITSVDAKMFHFNVLSCKNITLERLTIKAPAESPNTDGIHIGRSNGVNIINTKITTGDDCVSIGDGSEQIRITGVACGPGHGIAIGSLGKYPNEAPVRGIFVTDCTITGTDCGLRIKTWENSPVGEASDIHFENIQLTNVRNPILIDQEYCPAGNCPATEPPSRVKISNVSFKNIRGTSTSTEAVKIVCSKGVPCEGVVLSNIDFKYSGTRPDLGPINTTCTNVKNPVLTGRLSPAIVCGRK